MFLIGNRLFYGWTPLEKPVNVQKKKPGASRTIRTPNNIEQVRQSILQSPRRSVRKHAAALGMSDRSARRILHEELQFHSYKLAVVQELNPRDFISRKYACAEAFLTICPMMPLCSLAMTLIFIYPVASINRT